jgi:hypothetical protein
MINSTKKIFCSRVHVSKFLAGILYSSQLRQLLPINREIQRLCRMFISHPILSANCLKNIKSESGILLILSIYVFEAQKLLRSQIIQLLRYVFKILRI